MSSGPARPSAAAVLALNGSTAADSYCGEPRRVGKSRPTSRESGGCRLKGWVPRFLRGFAILGCIISDKPVGLAGPKCIGTDRLRVLVVLVQHLCIAAVIDDLIVACRSVQNQRQQLALRWN
jgi:hypothetical protein